MLHYVKKYQF